MNSKQFFYVAAGTFLLAATVNLTTQYVRAQENAQVVGVDEKGRFALDSLKRTLAVFKWFATGVLAGVTLGALGARRLGSLSVSQTEGDS